LFASRIEGSGQSTLIGPKVSTRRFSAWKKEKGKMREDKKKKKNKKKKWKKKKKNEN